MAYEVLAAGSAKNDFPRGKCVVSRHGSIRLQRADLAAVGISDAVTILFDADAMSIALRKPQGGELGNEVRFAQTDAKVLEVYISKAIKKIGIKSEWVMGMHDVLAADGMIQIRFQDESPEVARIANRRSSPLTQSELEKLTIRGGARRPVTLILNRRGAR